jgi:hypothetical protein
MIWMIEKFKTRLYIKEITYDVDVPIQIEIEYGLEGKRVDARSLSKKVLNNRPLLIKEARNRTAEELDNMVDHHVSYAIRTHLSSRGYIFDETSGLFNNAPSPDFPALKTNNSRPDHFSCKKA